MEKNSIIFTEKLNRKVKKTGTKRNPLQALTSAQNLIPNSSSKQDSLLRSKFHSRTPKSAPARSRSLTSNTISTNTSSIRNKTRPNTPDLLHQWNLQRKPISKGLSGGKMKKSESFVKPQVSETPRSNSTPPIHASISPEVPCASSVSPAPKCFATGHVMNGVQERRKCRPRGILTIGKEQSNPSEFSSAPPPLAEASVCWLIGSRSKVQTFDFDDKASVNWLLLSPSDVVETKSGVVDDEFGVEETPSSCTEILRTPISNSSVSPFSVIVQRAEASSRVQVLNSQKEKGESRYGNTLDVSPFSEKSWSNSGDVSSPSSFTNFRRNGVISPLEIDSATEDLGAMRLLSKPVLGNSKNDISPLHSLSFNFGFQPTGTTLNSIDLNSFKSFRCDESSKVEENQAKNLSPLGARISWREGLVSRIFEMGLDSYHSFFDDDEDADFARDGNVKSEFGFRFSLENGSSVFEKGNGFGSYELPVNNNQIIAQKRQSKVIHLEPNSFAESISTDGGLISSGDSDWTFFYKNNLFEV